MNTTSTRPSVPWTLSDLRSVFVALIGGLGLTFVAWWGASGTGRLDRQVTWTIVAIIGVIVIGVGSFLWLLSGRRAVALRRTSLVEEVERVLSPVGSRTTTPTDGSTAQTFVAIAGSQRYHRSDCQLVRGKDAHRLPTDGSAPDGLRPCEMCEPVVP